MSDKKEKQVSVAVATYNGEKYLMEQLESIAQNLRPGDEIVISDDGSTDRTLELVEQFHLESVTVRCLKGPQRGIKQNIANAISKCKGDYIFMADQDDVWTKDKVQKVLEVFEQTSTHLVVHDAKVVDGTLKKCLMPSFFAYRGSKAGFWTNVLKNRYMGCCMAMDAALLEKILPIPDTIEMHDWWIGVINDCCYKDTVFLPEKLLFYRRHEENVSDFSHNGVMRMIKNRLVFLRQLKKQSKKWKH